MGEVMAAHLLALLGGDPVDRVTVLPTRLVVRESA
jgi:DNA-binding LacI/PurR family transcriptional regulator